MSLQAPPRMRGPTCPTCDGPITGIATSGPSTHHAAPCGHRLGALTVREVRALQEGAR